MTALLGCEFQIPDGIAVRLTDAAPSSAAPCVDEDNDGTCRELDCDDADPHIAPDASEACNGVDDDCDGATDEGFGFGGPCTVFGPDLCEAPGLVVCDEQGLDTCGLHPDVGEACNGLDDDCDGSVDEGNPGGGGPCDGGGQGACAGGTFVCIEGALGCLANALPGDDHEVCDGVDNDCDGVADEAAGGEQDGVPQGIPMEAPCYGGAAGTADVGLCTAGTWTCVAGQWSACVGEVRPVAPKCSSADDADCDGVDDQLQPACNCDSAPGDQPCYNGPANTEGVGACQSGLRECLSNVWGDCVGEVLPEAEQCNGSDDDCDHTVDEGFSVGEACTVGQGACEVAGLIACSLDGLSAACNANAGAPSPEVCNGLDDDCDGSVDEVPGLGSDCVEGVGGCARPGVQVCPDESGALICNASSGVPIAELCNGVDDDCDALVDEAFTDLGEPCHVGVGACERVGTFICSAIDATLVCDVQPGGPSAEVCDGIDNNCDGRVDEDFGVTNPCVAPGVCGPGTLECAVELGIAVCSTGPNGSASAASFETCNGLDDDCDGAADEAFFGLGDGCFGCGGAPGSIECDASGAYTTCSTSSGGSQAPEEVCGDAIDNDCDGTPDEAACVAP